jgi:esterase/lipase
MLTFLSAQSAMPPPMCVSNSCRAVQATDKELVMVSNHWHVLIKEPGNEKIVERIIDWVHKRS